MKIAIASDWFAPRRGGIESQLLQLAERLGGRGHEVDVVTSTPHASEGDGFRVRQLDVLMIPGLELAVSPLLLHALRRELRRGYDVVHAHVSVVSPVGYVAAIVARSLGLPTVVTFHSVLRHKKRLLSAANALAGISRSAVVWSGVSELVAGQVRDALGSTEVSLLPNGIDLGLWRDTASPDRKGPGEILLVSTTRLHRKKRPLQLLRAFAQATTPPCPSVRLVVAGDGPQRAAMEREIVALGLRDGPRRVELRGWLHPSELRTLYAGADGFVLASMRESFGIAALEARAARLPIIAMAQSGSREFLDPDVNALICRDDLDLVAQLARFIRDPALRSRLAAGPTSLDRYDWSAVVSAHETAYARATTRAVAAGAVAVSA